MIDRQSKCPNCQVNAEETLHASGGFGVGEHQWYGDCDNCGASWEYWQRGKNGEKLNFVIDFDEDGED